MRKRDELLQLRRDARESGVEGRTERIDGGNDSDRDTGSNEAIFDGGCSRLVIPKCNHLGHLTRAPQLFAYPEYYTSPVKASLLANLQFDALGVADLFGPFSPVGLGSDPAAPAAQRGIIFGI